MAGIENKSQLRKQYRKERQDRFMTESWVHILSANEFKDVTNVASYVSYEFEPETSDINKKLLDTGKKLFLPRVLKNNDLEWEVLSSGTYLSSSVAFVKTNQVSKSGH